MPQAKTETSPPTPVSSGYADVNGIKLYHEICGQVMNTGTDCGLNNWSGRIDERTRAIDDHAAAGDCSFQRGWIVHTRYPHLRSRVALCCRSQLALVAT
jgi:hypothetical protein